VAFDFFRLLVRRLIFLQYLSTSIGICADCRVSIYHFLGAGGRSAKIILCASGNLEGTKFCENVITTRYLTSAIQEHQRHFGIFEDAKLQVRSSVAWLVPGPTCQVSGVKPITRFPVIFSADVYLSVW
jgi:hypothetical protein